MSGQSTCASDLQILGLQVVAHVVSLDSDLTCRDIKSCNDVGVDSTSVLSDAPGQRTVRVCIQVCVGRNLGHHQVLIYVVCEVCDLSRHIKSHLVLSAIWFDFQDKVS